MSQTTTTTNNTTAKILIPRPVVKAEIDEAEDFGEYNMLPVIPGADLATRKRVMREILADEMAGIQDETDETNDAIHEEQVLQSYDVARNILEQHKAGTLKVFPVISVLTGNILHDLCQEQNIRMSSIMNSTP